MDIEEIYQRMKGAVESGSGIHISSGGEMALRLYAAAAELYSLWTQADWLERQSFPQTATEAYLDSHAQLRGIQRRSGTSASGIIRFELNEARSDNVSIPAGTVCLNSAGLEFLTDSAAVIAAGGTYCLAPAAARDAGSFGNVPADSIYQMALAPAGVARCYNPAAFSGGTDDETDEALRIRVLDSYARLPNGSNAAYYETEALNTDGVGAVKVLARARGIGTVDIIIASGNGAPSQEIIDKLQEKLEFEREICVDLKVLAPETVPVNIAVSVEVKEEFDADTVIDKVSTALSSLFDGRLLGQNLLLAKIGNVVFNVDGVGNYKVTAPAADVAINANQLPVAGTIAVNRS